MFIMDIRKVHRTARGGINNDRTLLYLLPDRVPFLILFRVLFFFRIILESFLFRLLSDYGEN